MLRAEFAQSHASPTLYPINFASYYVFWGKTLGINLLSRIRFHICFSVSLSLLSKVRRLRLRIQKASSIQEATFDITSVQDGVSEIGLSSGRISIDLLRKQEELEYGGKIKVTKELK